MKLFSIPKLIARIIFSILPLLILASLKAAIILIIGLLIFLFNKGDDVNDPGSESVSVTESDSQSSEDESNAGAESESESENESKPDAPKENVDENQGEWI